MLHDTFLKLPRDVEFAEYHLTETDQEHRRE